MKMKKMMMKERRTRMLIEIVLLLAMLAAMIVEFVVEWHDRSTGALRNRLGKRYRMYHEVPYR